MTTWKYAPSLAHIIRHEAQALISAINDGDKYDTAGTLATIAELVHHMQLSLDSEFVDGMCAGCWSYNGRPIYPVHHRHDDVGQFTRTIPVEETREETA